MVTWTGRARSSHRHQNHHHHHTYHHHIIIITIINTIGNGDLEEQSKEWETKEEQKSSRDQGRQKVDRDVAGNRELGFCSTFVVEN